MVLDKDFVIVNKEEIDVFLELSSFFREAADVGNLISGNVERGGDAWGSESLRPLDYKPEDRDQ